MTHYCRKKSGWKKVGKYWYYLQNYTVVTNKNIKRGRNVRHSLRSHVLLHQSQDESWNLKNKESERQRELRVLQSQFEETTRQCEEVPLHTCFQF